MVLWNTQTSSSQYLRAKIAVATSWFYSLFWTLPPLFGWSRSVTRKSKEVRNVELFKPEIKV